MILFWNNTYYSGLSADSNITREMFEPHLPYYYAINYVVGLVFLSSFFIGVGLNPFVIKFNWSKRRSSVSLLFVITACADTMVCILIPMFYASLMLQPQIIFYNYMYEMYIVCVMCTFGCTSQVTTTLLGVCRFIKVMNPFYNINNTYLIVYLVCHVGYMFVQVAFIIMLILGKLENHNGVLFKLVFACFSISALHCVVGSVCSGLTVCKLYKITAKEEDKSAMVCLAEKRKSAITIFLMNIPHFITAGCIFTSMVSTHDMSWFDINFIFCPILTSTLNPILIITRSFAMKSMVRDYFYIYCRKCTSGPSTSALRETASQPETTTGGTIATTAKTEL